MVRYCSVYGCLETNYSNKNRKFFRFPSDEQRCKYWIKEIGRIDLEKKGLKTLHTSYFVCELHFVDSDRTKRVLKKNAVPTLLLPQLEDSSGTSKYTQTDITFLSCSCKFQTSAEIPKPGAQKQSVQHTDISCNNCRKVIVGFRYKCITCEDYDLCRTCEMMEIHSDHYVLRIPKPLKQNEVAEIAQIAQQIFKPKNETPPIKETDSMSECSVEEPTQDGNVNENIYLSDQFKNIIHSEVKRVIGECKDVRRKRKRDKDGYNERERDSDIKVNVVPEIVFADANSDFDMQNSSIDVKQEIPEESEVTPKLEICETVYPYLTENDSSQNAFMRN